MKDIDLYSAIYDIVDENMNNAGQKLRISKELVLSTTTVKPGKVDILKLSRERNNETFEGAVNDCVATLKDLLVSEKERRFKSAGIRVPQG